MRPHADLIKKWADNENAEVWVYETVHTKKWTITKVPTWERNSKYSVVLPEYKEAWQAYLDGELQISLLGEWEDWNAGIPVFDNPPERYRRAPKTPQVGEKWKHTSGNEFVKRLQLFAECCDDQDMIAEVIRDAYLNCRISLEEANKISDEFAIAGPLAYWTLAPVK